MFVDKDSERREQRQMKNAVFQFDYAKPHPNLFKDSKRREQRQMKNAVFQFDCAKLHPDLSEDNNKSFMSGKATNAFGS